MLKLIRRARFETETRSIQKPGQALHDDATTEIGKGYLMQVTRRARRDALDEWDRFVDGISLSDVTQLSGWSTIRADAGYSPQHVFIRRFGHLVAGAQILVRHVPILGSLGYLSAGPVIADDVDDRAGVVAAVGTAMRQVLSAGLRVLFVQPPAGAEDVAAELARCGFRASRAGIAPAASLRIDLGVDEEVLRERLGKRLRGWTRRWPEKGVAVRLGGEADLPLLAELVAKSAAFQGYEPLSLDYLSLLYNSLARAGNAAIFVGEVRGDLVAVDLYTRCGGVLRDRLIGFDRDSEASNLSVPAALKWYAMLWAKEQGIRWFDFGGMSVANAEALLAGHQLDQQAAGGSDFFKISFGGAPYLMPAAVEDARPRLALRVYDLAQRSKRGRALFNTLRRRLRGGGH